MDWQGGCVVGFFCGALPFLLLWREAVKDGDKSRRAIRGYERARVTLIEQDAENRRKYHVR